EKTVSPLVQLVAVMIDYFIIKFSWTLTLGFFITDEFIQLIYTIIGFLIIFFIVPIIWDGKTIGTKIMHFKLVKIKANQFFRSEKTVSPLVQLVAVMIDYFIIKFSWTLTLGFFITDEFIQLIYTIIGFLIIFFIVPIIWDGKTIATKIMHFKLVKNKANQSFWKSLWKRSFALFLPVMLTHLVRVLQGVEVDMNSLLYPYYVWGSTATIVFLFIMWITLTVHV